MNPDLLQNRNVSVFLVNPLLSARRKRVFVVAGRVAGYNELGLHLRIPNKRKEKETDSLQIPGNNIAAIFSEGNNDFSDVERTKKDYIF